MPIVYKCEEFPILLIVNTEHYWEVGVVNLEELITLKKVQAEFAFVERYFLIHTFLNSHLLYIVFFIRRVHHCRYIIHVSLLGYTCVHAQVAVYKGVDLHR